MNTVEVRLLNYRFRFVEMKWKKEFGIKFDPAKDRLRTILAHALDEVSGLKVKSIADATRIFEAIPFAVVYRIFLIYTGSLPEPKLFKTMGLYKAPEPNRFMRRIEEAEEQREKVMDRVEEEMAAKFGRKELNEARKLELEMLRKSKGRGLTKPMSDTGLGPVHPPVSQASKIPPVVVDAAFKQPLAVPRPLPPFRKGKR